MSGGGPGIGGGPGGKGSRGSENEGRHGRIASAVEADARWRTEVAAGPSEAGAGAASGNVAEPTNLSRLKSGRSPFYKDNPANALKTEQIR